MPTDIEIAQAATLRPISEIAEVLGIPEEALEPYGRTKAKVQLDWLLQQPVRSSARMVLVTAISPTPPGEGKTTTTVGLGDGLRHIGKDAMIAIREPSLGPIFGIKGGATGGGRAQVVPMTDINLHFTGDIHAITAAHNLVAATLDNRVYRGNDLGVDVNDVAWPRALDVDDRALRNVVVGLGGTGNGVPRESEFVITAASELMAVLGLAGDLADLRERVARVVVAYDADGDPVRIDDLGITGAVAALLRDAIRPNLVQDR